MRGLTRIGNELSPTRLSAAMRASMSASGHVRCLSLKVSAWLWQRIAFRRARKTRQPVFLPLPRILLVSALALPLFLGFSAALPGSSRV